MGTCLAANNARESHSEANLPTSPNDLRHQIAQQLKEPTLAQNINSGEEFSFHQQPSLKRNLSNKTDNLSEMSAKGAESAKKIVRKDKKHEIMPSQASIKKVELKNITQVSSSNQNDSEGCTSGQEDEQSAADTVKEDSEQLTQTPQNRKNGTYDQDMIGKGLTEDDNKMISLTLASTTPIRLNEVRLRNMSVYAGEWLQGKRHGQGVLKWSDGSDYKGAWLNNYSHGQGKLTYADGGLYEGQFQLNKAHGKGVFKYTNGSRYEGEWKDDEPDGIGVIEWPDGEKYDGEWQVGKKHGRGTINFKDGSFYKGEFQNNEIHGKGYYCWKDLKEYEGQWQHNQMHGKGKLTWLNGQFYEGSFFNGKYQGRGTMTYSDGSKADGNWEKGRKHGFFNEIDPAGNIKQVQWHMGKRAKPLIEYNRREAKRLKDQESKTTSSQQL